MECSRLGNHPVVNGLIGGLDHIDGGRSKPQIAAVWVREVDVGAVVRFGAVVRAVFASDALVSWGV